MDFVQEIWNKAKRLNKTIVLPEADDIRVLKATELILKSRLAKIILIGKEDEIKNLAEKNDADISAAQIVTPETIPRWINIPRPLRKEERIRG